MRHVRPGNGDDKQGFSIEFFRNNFDLFGQPIWENTVHAAEQMWIGEVGPGVNYGEFSARMRGNIRPRKVVHINSVWSVRARAVCSWTAKR